MRIVVLMFLLMVPTSVWAQGAFDFQLQNKTQTDQGKPALILVSKDFIKSGKVTFKRSDGKTRTVKIGRMRPAKKKRVIFEQPKGIYTYSVKVEGKTDSGETFATTFETEAAYVDPIKLGVNRDQVDVGEGKLILKSNQALDKVDIEVYDNDGKKVRELTQTIGGQSGDIQINWPKTGGEVGAIRLKAHDTVGFWNSVVLEPFWVEIPHREVIFDFGKATWQASENPKLEETLGGVKEAMKKHASKGLSMSLYIAGYTDTVGNNASNIKLSTARARAIAKWFKKQGLKLDVFYQGFGESVLAVKTADNTPEEKNRRALYILGNAPPPKSRQIPKSNWKRL